MVRDTRRSTQNLWSAPLAVVCLMLAIGADVLGQVPAIFRAFDSVAVTLFAVATLFMLVGNIGSLEALLENPHAAGSTGRFARLAAAAMVCFLYFLSLDCHETPSADGSVAILVSLLALGLVMASVMSLRHDRGTGGAIAA